LATAPNIGNDLYCAMLDETMFSTRLLTPETDSLGQPQQI
jgi:hypothetical protein